MKRNIITYLLPLLCLAICQQAKASDFIEDGIAYNILSKEDRTVEVAYLSTNYKFEGAIEIPQKVESYTVTSIGKNAFSRESKLTSISIPKSVTSIGESVFHGCTNLTAIEVSSDNPDYISIDGILYNKSQSCIICFPPKNSITNFVLPNSVTSIGESAFYSCSGLTSISIPNSVTTIGNSAFYGCSGLTSITIPNSVTSIGSYAFYRCVGLTSLSIPNSVTTIGNSAFYGCSGLTSISIPNSVTSIGNSTFYGCSGLTSISIPNSVTSIGNGVFYDCDGLTSITIPNSVTSIGDDAFSGCSGLTSITIPNSVTSIGGYAFYRCVVLTSITIPNSVTSIGRYAFYSCTGLTSVSIPNSVTTIGNSAFGSCSGLTSISIPNSVTSIGEDAFSSCDALNKIYCKWTTPIYVAGGFSKENYKNATLYVPEGCKSVYENQKPWWNFWNIEETDFSGIESIMHDDIEVSVGNGIVTVANATNIEIYSIKGQCVYKGNSNHIEGLAPGIYVVCADTKTFKIKINN